MIYTKNIEYIQIKKKYKNLFFKLFYKFIVLILDRTYLNFLKSKKILKYQIKIFKNKKDLSIKDGHGRGIFYFLFNINLFIRTCCHTY